MHWSLHLHLVWERWREREQVRDTFRWIGADKEEVIFSRISSLTSCHFKALHYKWAFETDPTLLESWKRRRLQYREGRKGRLSDDNDELNFNSDSKFEHLEVGPLWRREREKGLVPQPNDMPQSLRSLFRRSSWKPHLVGQQHHLPHPHPWEWRALKPALIMVWDKDDIMSTKCIWSKDFLEARRKMDCP